MPEDVETLLSRFEHVIAYQPLQDEPDWRSLDIQVPVTLVPQDASVDPIFYAKTLTTQHLNAALCLLIPGTRFDVFGTRHGRGGGWYDRFLAHVPRRWVRIGITDSEHLSTESLVRNAWDEPMDRILVREPDGSWRLICPQASSAP